MDPAIWNHSVSCLGGQVYVPQLNSSQTDWYLIYPPPSIQSTHLPKPSHVSPSPLSQVALLQISSSPKKLFPCPLGHVLFPTPPAEPVYNNNNNNYYYYYYNSTTTATATQYTTTVSVLVTNIQSTSTCFTFFLHGNYNYNKNYYNNY